jgi:enamine deaminase RidA (YjgF/YER057c/UK114 family)
VQWALEQAGATLDDVIRRRTFTVDSAQVNRPYGEGPAWFVNSCPVSMGCRVAGLARPELLVEVEAVALKGAHADIEQRGPDAADPLSR